MKLDLPGQIYNEVLQEIQKIINEFQSEKYEELDTEPKEQALFNLEKIKLELSSELFSLKENAEWDIFNIAFYGETNAGKSTLIETLRILLEDPKKLKERGEFDQKKQEFLKTKEALENYQSQIDKIKEKYHIKLNSIKENLDSQKIYIESIQTMLQDFETEKKRLEKLVEEKKEGSFLNKILSLFGLLNEQKSIIGLDGSIKKKSEELEHINSDYNALENTYELEKKQEICEIEKPEVQIHHLETTLSQLDQELVALSDGKIIGDGRPDFTKEVGVYHFIKSNQKFALLDLPGIEGNEELVKHNIEAAVQQAHVVFYISTRPTPPQNVNDQEGTLYKIKNHLSQHSEVYSLFNKRINNPHQIISGLIDEDEKESLIEHESVMKQALGRYYSGNKVISAYPAFLAVGKSHKESFNKSLAKFLGANYSTEKLLEISGLLEFSSWISSSLIKENRNKIVKSNYKKVCNRLEKTGESIRQIKDDIENLSQKVEKTGHGTIKQLDGVCDEFKNEINNVINREVEKIKVDFRKKIYEEIDLGISSSEFNEKYNELLEEKGNQLTDSLKSSFDSLKEKTEKKFNEIIQKHQRYEKELLELFIENTNFQFNNFDRIDSSEKSNIGKVLLSVFGILIAAEFGLPALVLAVVAAIFNIYKNLKLDSKKRMAHQKKVANEGIDKMCDEIITHVEDSLKSGIQNFEDSVENIKQEINKLHGNLKTMIYVLKQANEKVENIQKTIERKEVI